MKQTYNTHDIYAMVTELTSWIGYRVLNIYDIDDKTICIKFNSNKSEKKYLIIESGTKFYTLSNFTATKDFPSSFCSKLRKHINNKRLESIKQVNLDRVINLEFGHDDLSYHIIGEFYASGNIIFTDNQYKILNLIHPYIYTNNKNLITESNNISLEHINYNKNNQDNKNISEQIKVCVGQKYPFDYATTNVELSLESIKNMFMLGINKQTDKKIKLKQLVNKIPLIKYSPNVLEHSLKSIGIDPNKKISSETKLSDIFESDDKINNFICVIKELFEIKNFTGYKTSDNIYPFDYKHIDLSNAIIYQSFTNCSSIFWSELKPIETKEQLKQKSTQIKLSKQEKAIWNVEQQIKSMELNINNLKFQVNIITNNIELIEKIINLPKTKLSDEFEYHFNIFLSGEVDKNGQKNIKLLSTTLWKNTIKLNLEENIFDIDLTKSAFDNRELIFKKIKKLQDKKLNALEIVQKQKKNLQKNNYLNEKNNNEIDQEIQQFKNKYKVIGQSKPNWFEQFNWFFTSDNLLFICGKTSDQNEIIVKKYMESNDIYIHSETFGSGSGIIKNLSKLNITESFPSSLIEAGTFLIAHTKAWNSGVPNSAYWVRPDQVSKTPETGEYLTKGSFIIRGHKNFIQVHKMEMGFGILFKVSGSDNFKSNITSTEQIEYAIPVLSTYSSILDYKFKVKIIHGNQKIKKILPDVISYFIKKSNLYEKDAIKKISNDSIQKVLINSVKFIICNK